MILPESPLAVAFFGVIRGRSSAWLPMHDKCRSAFISPVLFSSFSVLSIS